MSLSLSWEGVWARLLLPSTSLHQQHPACPELVRNAGPQARSPTQEQNPHLVRPLVLPTHERGCSSPRENSRAPSPFGPCVVLIQFQCHREPRRKERQGMTLGRPEEANREAKASYPGDGWFSGLWVRKSGVS